MADEMEVITAKETKKYVSLTLSVKREIIQEVENGGKSQRNLAKQFGVSRTTIAQIVKDKDKILRQLEKSPESAYKRVKTEKYESINRLVIASLQEYIRRNQANPTGEDQFPFSISLIILNFLHSLSGTWIKKEALFFAENEGIETFTASNGWLHRFLKRYHIRLSNCARPTAPTDEIVEELDMTEMTEESFSEHNGDAIEEFVSFANDFSHFKLEALYRLSSIILYSQESEMDLCRLCGCKSSFDALCSLRDPELLIEMKLEKTFNMRLNNDKLLPQNICFQCISSLESSMAFLEMAEETQATLERNLNDQLQHCEPSIILENEIKVEEILTTSFEEVPCSSYQVLASPPRPRKRSRVRSAIPTKTHNPVMKMEDIFVKELTEGTFVSSPEMLEGLTEDEQNADGTINETGMYKLSHLGWFNYSWKCVQCHSVMETRTDLENHFKKEHKQHRISYACSDCKATFKGYLAFINHVTESHRPYMKFFCDLCCDFRWNLLDLYRHREDRHPKLRNTCLYCGKLYDCGFSLKQHIGVHLNLPEDQLFKCDLCNHQCHTKYLIKQHITLNHAKSHGELVCEQCGKICKRLSDMVSSE